MVKLENIFIIIIIIFIIVVVISIIIVIIIFLDETAVKLVKATRTFYSQIKF